MTDPYVKGLNRKGGGNLFRFENFKERVALVDVDEAHRVQGVHEAGADVELDPSHSYFKEELYRLMELDISKAFIVCSRRIAPMCQSLPQVLHHKRDIVNLLVDTLTAPASTICWSSVLAVIGFLAK